MKNEIEVEVVAETVVETVAEVIQRLFPTATELTMYQLSKVWSSVAGRYVREQMLYNYRTKKLVPVKENGRISIEDAVAFITKKTAPTTK